MRVTTESISMIGTSMLLLSRVQYANANAKQEGDGYEGASFAFP